MGEEREGEGEKENASMRMVKFSRQKTQFNFEIKRDTQSYFRRNLRHAIKKIMNCLLENVAMAWH